MFQILFFLWRRSDLNRRQFMEYYETKHAPLGVRLSPPMTDYRRNYPSWENASEQALGGFDVMTQIWHDNRATFEKQLTTMQVSPAKETIGEDEARFIDRGRQLFVTVDERGLRPDDAAEVTRSKAVGEGTLEKVLRFVRAPAGLEPPTFLEVYERNVMPEIEGGVPRIVGYRRNYALFDDPFSFSGGHHIMSRPDRSVRIFDLVEEIWLGGSAGGSTLLDIAAHSPSIAGCETYQVRVEERRSPGGRLMAPAISDAGIRRAGGGDPVC